ncbi:MAG: T9SS type A sorting domain-containing protein [Saprospiraceae bacterium]|nr:T9SS type A sorting domain-containing protein [Saprospiraceae bacterium]
MFLLLALCLGLHSASVQAQCSISVNANVNVSLPSTCVYTVPVSALLHSVNCPGGNLVAEILQGGVWVPANLNASHINQSITARVRDTNSGTYAVCTILVKDKIAPVITGCANITVNCEDACQPILAPTVSDCSPVTSTLTSTTENLTCASAYSRRITQTYVATDLYNNSTSCTRTIQYVRRAPTTVVYPSNITLQVSGTDCAPWCNNGSGRPSPTPAATGTGQFGSPTIDGSSIFPAVKTPGTCTTPCVSDACQLTVTYGDVVTNLCGTNRRIDRTWQVSAACGAPAVTNYLQRIWIYTDGNPTCGAACGVPYNLTQMYSPLTGTTTFLWSAPTSTCVVRYDIQYRLKVGGVWQPWVTASPGTNSYTASLTTGLQGEWTVRTRCNGVNSAYAPVKAFTTGISGLVAGPTIDTEHDNTFEDDFADAQVLSVFPNPSQGAVTFSFKEPVGENCMFNVTDLYGRLVYQTALMEGTLSMDLEMSSQSAGTYIAVWSKPDGEKAVARFVLTQ